jgi:hypothetical protein
MREATTRREFLKLASAGGAATGLGGLSFLGKLPAVSAQEARLNPARVVLDKQIAPLVKLLEDTPRQQVLERVAERIRAGTTYQEVVTALFLAAIQNISPRPTLGFKFHGVLVIHASHLASMASPDAADRWLPILWAVDSFKVAQAEEQKGAHWQMSALNESAVPPLHQAREAFIDAMEKWDDARADAAVVGLVRSSGANEVADLLYRYGTRDYRSLGHKSIFVANGWRLLQVIGWQHAETVARALTYACLAHDVKGSTPDRADSPLDRSWRRNAPLAKAMRADWMEGKLDDGATRELLAVFRKGSNDDASDLAAEVIRRGVSPQSVWDAIHCGAAELLMRQPGILALHAVTAADGRRYAFQACGDENTRKLLLLQNAAFLPMYREQMVGGGLGSVSKLGDAPIDTMQSEPCGSADEIFREISKDRKSAARKLAGYLGQGGDLRDLMNTARRLIFLKGSDHHDYKFSAAVFEDYAKVSPQWRDRFLATAAFYFRGSEAKNIPLVERIRAALGA